jgi:hypothetical protein
MPQDAFRARYIKLDEDRTTTCSAMFMTDYLTAKLIELSICSHPPERGGYPEVHSKGRLKDSPGHIYAT